MKTKFNYTEEFFLSIGFMKVADLKTKRNREGYLVWYKIFEDNSSIRVVIVKQSSGIWEIKKIHREGELAVKLIIKHVSINESMDGLVDLIKNNPMNTF